MKTIATYNMKLPVITWKCRFLQNLTHLTHSPFILKKDNKCQNM